MTKSSIHRAATILLAVLACSASAADLAVSEAWVRATVPGQRATGAFMQLTASSDATLVSAASPVAAVVEIHEMVMEGSVMKMRALSKLDLPAGRRVELRPGGYHIMLMDLRHTLKPGDVVPLTLGLDMGGKALNVELKAQVRELAATGSPMRH